MGWLGDATSAPARAPSKPFYPPLGCELVPVRPPGNRTLHSGYRQTREALRRCSRRVQCRNPRKSVFGHGATTCRLWGHHWPPGGLRRNDNRQRVPCFVFSKNGKGGQSKRTRRRSVHSKGLDNLQKGAFAAFWNSPVTSPDRLMLSGSRTITGHPEASSNLRRSAHITLGDVVNSKK